MSEKKFSDSQVNVSNQKYLSITGVESVTNMSPTKVELCVCGQNMSVCGTNMEVEKIDVDSGILKLKGTIQEIKYNAQKEKFFKRIFK